MNEVKVGSIRYEVLMKLLRFIRFLANYHNYTMPIMACLLGIFIALSGLNWWQIGVVAILVGFMNASSAAVETHFYITVRKMEDGS